jgi:limonene-1,2-epoxide hydrolase
MSGHNSANDPSMTAIEAGAFVTAFLDSWRRRDIEHILSFFAVDAVYHNVPVAPIAGLPGIRGIFQAFLDAFKTAALDIVTLAAAPDLVLSERIDRFELHDGRKVILPVNGVFVIRDRKIVRFSDYFDLATFERQSGMKL